MSDATVADFAAKLRLDVNEASFAAGDRLISGIKEAIVALGVFEGVRALAGLVEGVTEAAVGFEHLHQKLGISTDAIQELGFAANVSGASAEELQHAMQKMQFATANAQQHGTGPLVTGLGKLHISTAEWFKLNPEERIERLADGFADAGPEVDKTSVAMEILGRSGTTLLPMLNRGGDGIRELRKEARELGAVMDESTIKSFEEFEHTQKRLQAGMQGLKNTAVTALLPALKDLTDGALAWFKANRVEIAKTLTAMFQKLGDVLRFIGIVVSEYLVPGFKAAWGILSAVYAVLESVYDTIAKVVSESEELRDVLYAVAAIAGVVALALLAPWVLVVAGVAAAILIVQDLYSLFTGGPSILGDAFAALNYYFETSAPHALQVWWDRGKVVFAFYAEQLGQMIYLIDKVVSGFKWIGEHIDDIASYVPGLRSSGNAVAGFLTGNDIKSDASIADIKAGRGIRTEDEAAQHRANMYGGDMFGFGGAPQTYGQQAQMVMQAPALGGLVMHVTVQGNMTPDTVDAMHSVFSTAWDNKMRELQAQTDKP